jgi:hypothetical protein
MTMSSSELHAELPGEVDPRLVAERHARRERFVLPRTRYGHSCPSMPIRAHPVREVRVRA